MKDTAPLVSLAALLMCAPFGDSLLMSIPQPFDTLGFPIFLRGIDYIFTSHVRD